MIALWQWEHHSVESFCEKMVVKILLVDLPFVQEVEKCRLLIVKVLINELAFIKILPQHQVPLQALLCHWDAEFLEPQKSQ